ncbi:MAG: hypothetical protein R3281_06365, partial [Balneolaceae bacterium]|nr:hypothetical protein [Balneolaceae bacterium]
QRIHAISEQMGPAVDTQRAQIDYEGLRVDLMEKRISLAQNELQIERARADFRRMEQLYDDSLISERQYDSAKTELEVLKVARSETRELISHLQDRISQLEQYRNINPKE